MVKDKNGTPIRVDDEVKLPGGPGKVLTLTNAGAVVRLAYGALTEAHGDDLEVKTPVLTTPAGDERYAEAADTFNKMCRAMGNSSDIPPSVGALLRSEIPVVALLDRLEIAVEILRGMMSDIDRTRNALARHLVKCVCRGGDRIDCCRPSCPATGFPHVHRGTSCAEHPNAHIVD